MYFVAIVTDSLNSMIWKPASIVTAHFIQVLKCTNSLMCCQVSLALVKLKCLLISYAYKYFYAVCVWCVHLWVAVYMFGAHNCVHACRGQSRISGVIFYCSLCYCLETESHTEFSSADQSLCLPASLRLQEHMAILALVFTGNLSYIVSKHQ